MFETLRRTRQQLGASNAILYWMSRLLHQVSRGHVRLVKYLLVAQPVCAEAGAPTRRGQSIVVAEATERAIHETDFGRPAHVISQRLAAGARCLLATKNDTLVGFQWFTTRDYPEDEVRCVFEVRPQDHCAWDFDIFVHPEYRTQPVFLRLWDQCNALLRAEGITLSLSRINAFNTESLRAHGRLGATPIAAATFLLAGKWQFARLPTSPWLHMSKVAAPRLPISRLARERQTGT